MPTPFRIGVLHRQHGAFWYYASSWAVGESMPNAQAGPACPDAAELMDLTETSVGLRPFRG